MRRPRLQSANVTETTKTNGSMANMVTFSAGRNTSRMRVPVLSSLWILLTKSGVPLPLLSSIRDPHVECMDTIYRLTKVVATIRAVILHNRTIMEWLGLAQI